MLIVCLFFPKQMVKEPSKPDGSRITRYAVLPFLPCLLPAFFRRHDVLLLRFMNRFGCNSLDGLSAGGISAAASAVCTYSVMLSYSGDRKQRIICLSALFQFTPCEGGDVKAGKITAIRRCPMIARSLYLCQLIDCILISPTNNASPTLVCAAPGSASVRSIRGTRWKT